MSSSRTTTAGATTAASPCFSSAIGVPNSNLNLAIRVGAAASPILRCNRASTIVRCNGAGGKTRHAARRPHGRSGSFSIELGGPRHVRFPPDSDRITDNTGGRVRAKGGGPDIIALEALDLEQCNYLQQMSESARSKA